jgi:S-DNA-T family DNA segregation ATPase FtsK/SpoIIIE
MATDYLNPTDAGTGGDRSHGPEDHRRVLTGTVVPGPRDSTFGTGPQDHQESVYEDLLHPAVKPTPGTGVERRTITGAAVVVARKANVVARCGWTGTRWFGYGSWHGGKLAWRYVRAHDRIEDLGGTGGQNWRRIDDVRARRWRVLGWSTAGTAVGDLLAWWAMTAQAHLPALDPVAWGTAPGLEGVAVVSIATLYGRYRFNTQLGPGEYVAPEDMQEEDPNEPFPISYATTAQEASECLSRALYAEGIVARELRVLSRPAWGWEFDVLLKGSTPAKAVAAADDMEGHMDLPVGRFMPEPASDNRSRMTVRLVMNDPFANMPRPAVHTPRSLSVHDLTPVGQTMDGTQMVLSFDGFCALVVGAMGAGKTLGALRTFAEALTACRDAVCWDLDPLKGGLEEFGDLMAKRARGPKECENLIDLAVGYIKGRAKIIRKIGMGDRWVATPEHPNLYIFIDEFLQLSPKGKKAAVDGIRTGRQYGIYFVIAGQEAVSDALGDAIASIMAYRILMACRFEDVRIAFGPGKGALGWRPDRMEPSVGPVTNDAGQTFVMGGAFTRPIRHRFNAYQPDQITAAIPERLAAGMPQMDVDTLRAAPKQSGTQDAGSLIEQLADIDHPDADHLAAVLELFAKHEADFAPTALITEHLRRSTTWEPGSTAGLTLGSLIKRHNPSAKASKGEWEGKGDTRGWKIEPVLTAAEALVESQAEDPS